MSDIPENLSAQLSRLAAELRQIERRLGSDSSPPIAVLNAFRQAVDNVRMKAWSVSELINARYTKKDPGAILTFLAAERLRRLDQLVRNLCGDIERGAVTFQTSGMHSLSDSLNVLQQRIAMNRYKTS